MKKRLEQIKQADRKAYYELANEIGISEYSLYNYMTKGEYSLNTEEKIKKYLKKYKTKDEQIKQWKKEYNTLDACCELAQGKIAELKAENERLKELVKVREIQTNFAVGRPTRAQEYAEKYYECLQEIKEYAESIGNEEMISGYAIRAKSALWQIANKITKAEEE